MKKLYYKDREITDNAVDYGDGTVMISYKDDGDVAIIKKSEIEVRDELCQTASTTKT